MASFYGFEPQNPLFLGTAQYPSPAILAEAVKRSGVEVVTVSLRRESSGGAAGQAFWALIRELGVKVLPNTSGWSVSSSPMTDSRSFPTPPRIS